MDANSTHRPESKWKQIKIRDDLNGKCELKCKLTVMHPCCSPFASSTRLHERAIAHRWMFVHSCLPFWVPNGVHCILDAFESDFLKKKKKQKQDKTKWENFISISLQFLRIQCNGEDEREKKKQKTNQINIQQKQLFYLFYLKMWTNIKSQAWYNYYAYFTPLFLFFLFYLIKV